MAVLAGCGASPPNTHTTTNGSLLTFTSDTYHFAVACDTRWFWTTASLDSSLQMPAPLIWKATARLPGAVSPSPSSDTQNELSIEAMPCTDEIVVSALVETLRKTGAAVSKVKFAGHDAYRAIDRLENGWTLTFYLLDHGSALYMVSLTTREQLPAVWRSRFQTVLSSLRIAN